MTEMNGDDTSQMEPEEQLTTPGPNVTVGPFFQETYVACCAWIRERSGNVLTRAWVQGSDPYSKDPPQEVLEMGLYCALRITEEYLLRNPEDPHANITVRAGNWRTIRALHAWFHGGVMRFTSSAAAEVVQTTGRIIPRLRGKLIVRAIPMNFSEKFSHRG